LRADAREGETADGDAARSLRQLGPEALSDPLGESGVPSLSHVYRGKTQSIAIERNDTVAGGGFDRQVREGRAR
jgi:hypothetical protein